MAVKSCIVLVWMHLSVNFLAKICFSQAQMGDFEMEVFVTRIGSGSHGHENEAGTTLQIFWRGKTS